MACYMGADSQYFVDERRELQEKGNWNLMSKTIKGLWKMRTEKRPLCLAIEKSPLSLMHAVSLE